MPTKLFRNDIKAGTPLRLVYNDTNGKLAELVYHLNSDNSWATANDAENLRMVSQYAIKQYIASQISQSGSVTEWVDSINAIEYADDYGNLWSACLTAHNGELPGSEEPGVRYCVIGTFTDDSSKNNIIMEWTGVGTVWEYTTPSTGMSFLADNDPTDGENTFYMWVYNGTTWVKKTFGITYTGGDGITITGSEVKIKILTSNSGLTLTSSGLSLKADTSNFKIDDANGLGFKNGTAVGQVWYWNGSNWVADTISNLVNSKYKTNVEFSGTKNGSNKAFVINNGAGSIVESSLTVYKNGMRMDKTVDYTYVNSTKTLTFTTDTNAPESDTILVCDLFEV